MARDLDLDLVEVADKASPPVVRIMDYGKFKYEAAQKARESRRKASHVSVKEMKYRPKIGGGDFETKTRKVAQFLSEGHKVKVTIMFRGREVQHPELGKRILDEVAEEVAEVGKVEAYPRVDGRNMVMVLAPDRGGRPRKPDSSAERIENKPTNQPIAPDTTAGDGAAPPAAADGVGPGEGSTAGGGPAAGDAPAGDGATADA